MQKQLEFITLNDLLEGEYMGLATTESAIQAVLNNAVRTHSNEFYVGTDVKQWLSSFNVLTQDDMEERFALLDEEGHEKTIDSWKKHSFEVLGHDNSYNWSGHSNVNIDFRLLQSENGVCYAYVRVHCGGDVRGNYTIGILLDLETDNKDCFINFVDNIYEHINGGYIEIDGVEYGIYGNILSEYLEVYNHITHESYEVCESVYELNQEGFEKALKEVVEVALQSKDI